MKRITGFPTRPNMVQQLLDVGFDYYNLPSSDGSHYWSDNVAYEFTLAEIDRIEDATNELHAMCMDFVADEIKQGDYAHYRFTDLQKNLIEQTWLFKSTFLIALMHLIRHVLPALFGPYIPTVLRTLKLFSL